MKNNLKKLNKLRLSLVLAQATGGQWPGGIILRPVAGPMAEPGMKKLENLKEFMKSCAN